MKISPFVRSAWWLLVEKAIKIANVIVISIFFANYLGPEKFGILSYALSYVSIFIGISTLGLNNVLARKFIHEQHKSQKYLTNSSILCAISAACLYVLLCLLVAFSSQAEEVNAIVLVIGCSIFFQQYSLVEVYFTSSLQSKFIAKCGFICVTISLILKSVLLINGVDLIYIAWSYVFDAFNLMAMYALLLNISSFSLISQRLFSVNQSVSLLKQSWPYMLSALLVAVYMKIDQIMIMDMLGSEQVGIYAASVRLSEAWYFLPIIVVSAFYPKLSILKNDDKNQYEFLLRKMYRNFIFISVVVAIFAATFSNEIIRVVYGAKYDAASGVLSVNIWTGLFVAIGVLSDRWILDHGLQIISLYNTAIGALINIVLNFIFIPKYGIVGAAWATLIAYCASAYVCLAIWPSTRRNFILITYAFNLYRIINKH